MNIFYFILINTVVKYSFWLLTGKKKPIKTVLGPHENYFAPWRDIWALKK